MQILYCHHGQVENKHSFPECLVYYLNTTIYWYIQRILSGCLGAVCPQVAHFQTIEAGSKLFRFKTTLAGHNWPCWAEAFLRGLLIDHPCCCRLPSPPVIGALWLTALFLLFLYLLKAFGILVALISFHYLPSQLKVIHFTDQLLPCENGFHTFLEFAGSCLQCCCFLLGCWCKLCYMQRCCLDSIFQLVIEEELLLVPFSFEFISPVPF